MEPQQFSFLPVHGPDATREPTFIFRSMFMGKIRIANGTKRELNTSFYYNKIESFSF